MVTTPSPTTSKLTASHTVRRASKRPSSGSKGAPGHTLGVSLANSRKVRIRTFQRTSILASNHHHHHHHFFFFIPTSLGKYSSVWVPFSPSFMGQAATSPYLKLSEGAQLKMLYSPFWGFPRGHEEGCFRRIFEDMGNCS